MSNRPSRELPTAGRAEFERAREAVAAIRGRGRGPDGRVLPGNTIAMRTGLHSRRLLDAPDIAAWHREQVRAITADLGGERHLTALQHGLVREAARVEVILGSLGEQLLQGGVLTPKGKMRSAATLYLQVLDRFQRLSSTLGLERKARQVSLDDYLDEQARRVNAPDTREERR